MYERKNMGERSFSPSHNIKIRAYPKCGKDQCTFYPMQTYTDAAIRYDVGHYFILFLNRTGITRPSIANNFDGACYL